MQPLANATADADFLGRQLRLRRKVRGLSLQDVAEKSGVSIGQLSQIERGLSSPSLKSLGAVCRALDMPMGWLFDGPANDPTDDADTIVRARGRRSMDLGHKGMVKELLTPDAVPGIQMMRIVIQPGGSSGAEPYNNATGAKCGLVVLGTLGLEVAGRTFQLEPGDSFAFDATNMIRFWCAGDHACEVVWVVTPAVY
jgi:transcriptional regulator with XRE-family HTH domain